LNDIDSQQLSLMLEMTEFPTQYRNSIEHTEILDPQLSTRSDYSVLFQCVQTMYIHIFIIRTDLPH